MNEANLSPNKEFNKIQSVIWPIHNYELKKFLPMCFLMFCTLFVYTMVRDLKDTFIQKYAICGGTELIPVLKLWFVMPAAILTVMLFTFLVSKFGSTKTFYIMISLFIAFYATFVLILFPNVGLFHANAEQIRKLQAMWPSFCYYVIPCITNWSYTLFYVVSELWGTIVISSLFWQFANQITKKDEVKRFYGLYSLLANFGTILSGTILVSMSNVRNMPEFTKNIKALIWICIAGALVILGIFYYINKRVLSDAKFYNPDDIKETPKKEKVGIMEGLKILITSPYIMLVAVLIIAYGISINFFEVVWKEQMRITLTNADEYTSMMGKLSITTGTMAVCVTLLSTNILRRFKWIVGAIITPAIMITFGSLFFGLMIYNRNNGSMLFGYSVPLVAIWLGLIANALIKSIKYCLFDSTKNMAYRPLDHDAKTKGQAAVEIIGGRGGKASASLINYILTNVVSVGSKISAHIYAIIPMFLITVGSWIFAVIGLSKKYEKKITETENNAE